MNRNVRAFVVAALTCAAAVPAVANHHVSRELKLPGNDGWDYLTLDDTDGRLFVSHGTQVAVVDTRSLSAVGRVPETPGVHGVAVDHELGRGFATAGASSSVVVFDLKTLARVGTVKTTGENPDAILFEPTTRRILTFNGRGRNVTVIDPKSLEVLGTIALDAKPEFAVHDGTGNVFVNLEDKNSIAVLDPRTLTVKAMWRLASCDEPSGLAIDRAHHRLFTVCSNKLMEVVDSTNGRSVATLPIGDGVDGAAFDAGAQLAFASGDDGTLTVVKEEGPDTFSVSETVATKPGARTLTLDEKSHRVYLSTAQRATVAAPGGASASARPPVIPNTFEVLVVEP